MKESKILHIITGLGDGGAEATLVRLCLADYKNDHYVISLMDEGKYGEYLRKNNVQVKTMNMPQGKITLKGMFQLYKTIKLIAPNTVQTWMYHADLLGGIMARFCGVKSICWGVHNAILEPGKSKLTTIISAKICALFSYIIPTKIIFCAKRSKEIHNKIGYSKSKSSVIFNGYDTGKFNIALSSLAVLKEELGLLDEDFIVGMVGRFDPYKDHKNLLQSLNLLNQKDIKYRCLLIGTELTKENEYITALISKYALSDKVMLLGQRSDIPEIMNLLDVHILSSSSEAFPNVINEAMACGTPCITTDVGDAAYIVGDFGWVVKPKSPTQLCEAINHAYSEKHNNPEKWKIRIACSRERIINNFSINTMVEKYDDIWKLT